MNRFVSVLFLWSLLTCLSAPALAEDLPPLDGLITAISQEDPELRKRLSDCQSRAASFHALHFQVESALSERLSSYAANPIDGLADPPQTQALIGVTYIGQSLLLLNREFTNLTTSEMLYHSSAAASESHATKTLAFALINTEYQLSLTQRMLDLSIAALEETLSEKAPNSIDIYFNGEKLLQFYQTVSLEVAEGASLVDARIASLKSVDAEIDFFREQFRDSGRQIEDSVVEP